MALALPLQSVSAVSTTLGSGKLRPALQVSKLSLAKRDFPRSPLRAGSQKLNFSSIADIRATAAEPASLPATKELVEKLLVLVADTDSGAATENVKKMEIEKLFCQLEENCMEEPLKSPLVFGEWDVVYTSSPSAAGGYYRSLLGRSVLNTLELVQTIQEPNVVGNRVVFRALNLIPGRVFLQGKFEALDKKWVKVTFESPTLELGTLNFTYGGISTVQLSVIYLDERIRLGRGSRGSLFVFKRR